VNKETKDKIVESAKAHYSNGLGAQIWYCEGAEYGYSLAHWQTQPLITAATLVCCIHESRRNEAIHQLLEALQEYLKLRDE